MANALRLHPLESRASVAAPAGGRRIDLDAAVVTGVDEVIQIPRTYAGLAPPLLKQ